MSLEASRAVRLALQVVVGGVENWNPHSQSDGSEGRQQLKGSASPTNLNRVEDGLPEQDGDRELFEDPFVFDMKL